MSEETRLPYDRCTVCEGTGFLRENGPVIHCSAFGGAGYKYVESESPSRLVSPSPSSPVDFRDRNGETGSAIGFFFWGFVVFLVYAAFDHLLQKLGVLGGLPGL